MNKRYIDFVPAKSKTKTVKRGQAAPRVVHAELPKKPTTQKPAAQRVTAKKQVVKKPVTKKPIVQKPVHKVSTSVSKPNMTPALGVVEDFGGSNVAPPKQPLSNGPVASASEAKAQKVKAEGVLRSAPKVKETPAKLATSKTNSTYKAPNSPFINQSKVEKRPLSKNVYQKKIAVPKEEPKGPVTIISKPEKDSHVGIIVTIIMTIILGATAGTVAFLLLPK